MVLYGSIMTIITIENDSPVAGTSSIAPGPTRRSPPASVGTPRGWTRPGGPPGPVMSWDFNGISSVIRR